MSQRARLTKTGAGVGALALTAFLSFRCARAPERSVEAPEPAATGAYEPPARASSPAAISVMAPAPPPAASAAGVAVAASAPTLAPSAQGGVASVVAAVRARDPRDLALLSRIERESQRDPPPLVHELIRRREAGATREQLLTSVQQIPASDLALKVQLQRWLDEMAPAPGATSGAPAAPRTTGSARPLIRPITATP